MAHRYEFLEAAAKDLFKLTRHNQPLLHELVACHIPIILGDPHKVGEPKKGDLAQVLAYNFKFRGVAYRFLYLVEGEVVRFVAIGPHDVAYRRARRR